MITRSLPTSTLTAVSPVKFVLDGFASAFAAIEVRQEARAKRAVKGYLARQSDTRLQDLGFSATQIAALRR